MTIRAGFIDTIGNPMNYVRYSERLAEEIAAREPNGAIWANQFDNLANREAHVTTTGLEIWEQTEGKVDAFVSSVGTGSIYSSVTWNQPSSGAPSRFLVMRPWPMPSVMELPSALSTPWV